MDHLENMAYDTGYITMKNIIQKTRNIFIQPPLQTLTEKEMQHHYEKQRLIRYIYIGLSLVFVILCLNAMYSLFNTMRSLETTEVQFYTGLTVFTVFVITGIIFASELQLSGEIKQIQKNQINIIQLIKEKKHQQKCQKLDEIYSYIKEEKENNG